MTANAHPGELLVDYVDARLDADRAAAIRRHLASCVECRVEERRLVAGRDAARALRVETTMPADLVATVQRTLDAGLAAPATPRPTSVRVHPVVRVVLGGLAAAAVVWLYLQIPPGPGRVDVPTLVAHDARAVGSRALPLALKTSDAAALERYLAETPGPRVRVIDLAMMQIVLEGGLRHTLGSRASALYAYRTPAGARLVCQMFEGRLADLPPPVEVRESDGFRFQVYSRDGLTLVFWQEGDLVCVLASDLPAEEVITLARAKAMAPV